MRCLLALLIFVFVVSLAACPVRAQEAIGYSDAAVLLPDPTANCSVGVLTRNDDGSAENGYSWGFGGIVPPYYGAFGEAYDLGPGTVACGAFWLSQIGYHWGRGMDVYVWDGGVTREPEGVLCMVPDVVPTNVPFWPDCGQNDFHIGCDVAGEFTLGYWVDFHDCVDEWYVCSDENGPGGHPWTCIAPGIGYPTGWNHVTVIFHDCKSLIIAPFFNPRDASGVDELPEERHPAEAPTWGRIKEIFGE